MDKSKSTKYQGRFVCDLEREAGVLLETCHSLEPRGKLQIRLSGLGSWLLMLFRGNRMSRAYIG